MIFITRITNRLLSGNTHLKKEVISSLTYQFFTNAIGLLIVPLTLGYIDKEKYGIWVTANSLVVWLQNMNFGMGFGMQNKVTESLADNNPERARIYVSVVYKYTFLIGAGLMCAGLIASYFVNWNRLFNSSLPHVELQRLALITFVCFTSFFIFSNLNPLLTAVKQTSVSKLLGLFMNMVTVFCLYGITFFSHDNLSLATLALSAPLPVVYIISTLVFFKKNANLAPKWNLASKKYFKEVFSIGGKFLIMQLTSLVIFFTGSLIITQFLGPEQVTPFNIVSKYFYFPLFIFTLGIAPIWPAFTEAYVKKEFSWIHSIVRKLFRIATLASIGTVGFSFAGFYLIPIWTRHAFDIHLYSTMMWIFAGYTIIMFFSAIVSTFLNALTILNYQLTVQIVAAVLFLACSIGCIKYTSLGPASVPMGMGISMLFYVICCVLRMRKELKKAVVT
jgi:O-antigen/teichoic acid export membrane protein